MSEIFISKRELETLYLKGKTSKAQISKILKCSICTVYNKFKKYRIRTIKEKFIIPEIKLKELYCNKKLSATKIGKIFKCGRSTIESRLRKYKIKMRDKRVFVPRNKLYKLYWIKKISIDEIAKILKMPRSTIYCKFKQYKIKIRSVSEARMGIKASYETRKLFSKLHKGKGNPMYGVHRFGKKNPFYGKCHSKKTKKQFSISHGGTGIPGELSEYGPEFNKQLKEKVRDFWNRKCMFPECGIPGAECLTKIPVHHIDYDKMNNCEVNLIPLCRKHNAMVNKNRKFWEEYFTKLMISRISIKKIQEI